LQQHNYKLIGQVGTKLSGRYPCKATDLNYVKPLVFEDLAS